jgi:hypothetical protein
MEGKGLSQSASWFVNQNSSNIGAVGAPFFSVRKGEVIKKIRVRKGEVIKY